MFEDNKKCPLCGKKTIDEEAFCRDCQDIANNAYPDDLLTHRKEDDTLTTEIEEYTIQIEEPILIEEAPIVKQKNGKGLTVFFIVALVVLVITGGVSSYIFVQNKHSEETEIAYWNQCIEENSPSAYSKYLVQYPDGKFTEEAHSKIFELKESERKEWEIIRKSGNTDRLFAFLTDHTETPFRREINTVIDSLSWLAAAKDNTVASYQAYIENVKLGRYEGNYIDSAQQKYDYLSQLKTIEGDELNAIKEVITNTFKALSSTQSKDFTKTTAPILVRFYTINNQQNSTVTDSIKKVLRENKIKNITYTPDLSALEVIKDNKDIYFTFLSVKAETTFNDRKKKKEISKKTIKIELNKDKLIQSIYKHENI